MCPAGPECLGSACADLGLVRNSGRKKDRSGEGGGKEGPREGEGLGREERSTWQKD